MVSKVKDLQFILSKASIRLLILGLIFFLGQSCAYKKIYIEQPTLTPKYKTEFDFSGTANVSKQLDALRDLKVKNNQKRLVDFLIAFQMLSKKSYQDQITFMPLSKTKINLASFCASSEKAVPASNELYSWEKNELKVPLLKELLKAYRTKTHEISQNTIQEIIWNLENATYF